MNASSTPRRAAGPCRGAVLLEVVLALVLAFSAGTVLVGSLGTSIAAMRRVRLEARAADLAVTVASQMQIGLLDVENAGPTEFEDASLAGWTWQVVTTPVTTGDSTVVMTQAEVVIVNAEQKYTYRLVQWFAPPPEQDTLASGAAATGGRL